MRRFRFLAACVASSMAILILVGLGFRSIGDSRLKIGEQDFAYVYVAGYSWRIGHDPYDYRKYRSAASVAIPAQPGRLGPSLIDCSYAYAPTSAGIAMAVSALRFDAGRLAFVAINLLALASVAALAACTAIEQSREHGPTGATGIVPWLILVMTLSSPAAAYNVQMGQTTLFALALLCGSWWCRDHGSPIACGVLAALATFKPSVSVFVVFALVFERSFRTLVAMFLTAIALAWVPLVNRGPIAMVAEWMGSVRLYMTFSQNSIGNPEAVGVSTLLSSIGCKTPFCPIIGFFWFLWVVRRRRYFHSNEYFGVLLALAVLFTNAHFYDWILAYPMLFMVLAVANRSHRELAWCLAFVAMLTLPVGYLRPWVFLPAVWHFRELVLILLCLGVTLVCERRFRGMRA
jgi:Glycosyltransferase family 87